MTNEGGVTSWSGGLDWGTALNNITPEDIEALMETGLDGIALSGTILGAEDPAAQTQLIIKKLNKF